MLDLLLRVSGIRFKSSPLSYEFSVSLFDRIIETDNLFSIRREFVDYS